MRLVKYILLSLSVTVLSSCSHIGRQPKTSVTRQCCDDRGMRLVARDWSAKLQTIKEGMGVEEVCNRLGLVDKLGRRGGPPSHTFIEFYVNSHYFIVLFFDMTSGPDGRLKGSELRHRGN